MVLKSLVTPARKFSRKKNSVIPRMLYYPHWQVARIFSKVHIIKSDLLLLDYFSKLTISIVDRKGPCTLLVRTTKLLSSPKHLQKYVLNPFHQPLWNTHF